MSVNEYIFHEKGFEISGSAAGSDAEAERRFPESELIPADAPSDGVNRDRTPEPDNRHDFIFFGNKTVELNVAETMTDAHRAQVLHYVNATELMSGVSQNFGHQAGREDECSIR